MNITDEGLIKTFQTYYAAQTDETIKSQLKLLAQNVQVTLSEPKAPAANETRTNSNSTGAAADTNAPKQA